MKIRMLLLLCLLCTSCILDGTDTGNPGISNENCGDSTCNQMSDGDYESKLSGVVHEICRVINDCKSQSIDSCREAIKTQRNIDSEVGLGDSDYETVEDIILAERYGFLVADGQAALVCEADIQSLDCMDSKVDAAYDSDNENPYEKTAEVFPASCVDLFSNRPSEEEDED